MKGKIIALLLCSAVVLGAGVSIAYYNTKTFGFDENAKLIEKGEDKIKFMDFEFYYDDANELLEKAVKYVPKTHPVI